MAGPISWLYLPGLLLQTSGTVKAAARTTNMSQSLKQHCHSKFGAASTSISTVDCVPGGTPQVVAWHSKLSDRAVVSVRLEEDRADGCHGRCVHDRCNFGPVTMDEHAFKAAATVLLCRLPRVDTLAEPLAAQSLKRLALSVATQPLVAKSAGLE